MERKKCTKEKEVQQQQQQQNRKKEKQKKEHHSSLKQISFVYKAVFDYLHIFLFPHDFQE